MIPANIVAQVMSISQVTQMTQLNIESTKDIGGSGGGRCCGHNDFRAIFDDIAAMQEDGLAVNSPFFPGFQDNSLAKKPSSELVDFFSSIIAGSGNSDSAKEDPYSFMQSLSMSQLTTFQSIQYVGSSQAGGGLDLAGARDLLQQVSASFSRREGNFLGGLADNQFAFPPVDAPPGVAEAWDKASAGASSEDKMLVSGLLLGFSLANNIPSKEAAPPPYFNDGAGVGGEDPFSWDFDQYWQQVETLLALIDRSLQQQPERESDTEGAKDLLTRFLDELQKVEELNA